jgi:hypothetical protein
MSRLLLNLGLRFDDWSFLLGLSDVLLFCWASHGILLERPKLLHLLHDLFCLVPNFVAMDTVYFSASIQHSRHCPLPDRIFNYTVEILK